MTKGVLFILALWLYACVRALFNPWVGFVGYATYVVLCPQWNWRWGWYTGIDYQKFLAGTTFLGFILTGAISNRINKTAKSAVLCFTAFLAITWISSLQTISPPYTSLFWNTIWKIWLMACLGIYLIDDAKKLKWAIWAMVLSQGWNAWNVNELYYTWGINVRWFEWNYNDNNTYCISAVPIMALAFGLMLIHINVWIRLLCGFIFVLQLHQIMLLQSRGTMIGAILMGGLGFIFMPKTTRSMQVFFVGVVAASLLAGPSVIEEFTSSFKQTEELDSSASSRYKVWKAGASITLSNPLLGVGPWGGQFLVPGYLGSSQDRKALHNLFFDISTGVGIPGLMCYLLFFFLPWLAHFKRWYTGEVGSNDYSKIINLATLCGIPAYWLASMFSSGVFLESSYLLVCVSCSGLLLMDLQDEEIEALEGIDQEDFFEETQLDEEFGPLVGSA
jgi:hypothetical protein